MTVWDFRRERCEGLCPTAGKDVGTLLELCRSFISPQTFHATGQLHARCTAKPPGARKRKSHGARIRPARLRRRTTGRETPPFARSVSRQRSATALTNHHRLVHHRRSQYRWRLRARNLSVDLESGNASPQRTLLCSREVLSGYARASPTPDTETQGKNHAIESFGRPLSDVSYGRYTLTSRTRPPVS